MPTNIAPVVNAKQYKFISYTSFQNTDGERRSEMIGNRRRKVGIPRVAYSLICFLQTSMTSCSCI